MARRRMFSLDIVDTDAFLEMPASAQNLYFHLGMRADDDGFISSPRKITSFVNCSPDDYKILLAKGYIFHFKSGICVIRDWRINNYIQSDRYTPTLHEAEKQALISSANRHYEMMYTECIQDVSETDTQVRLGKVREDKGSIDTFAAKPPKKSKTFIPPSLEEVKQYVSEKNLSVDPQSFIDYFEAADWHDSKGQKVKNWKQKLLTWNKGNFGNGYKAPDPVEPPEIKGIRHY